MSADNGIYILETYGPEYRVAHLQAVENVQWDSENHCESDDPEVMIVNARRMWKNSEVFTIRLGALEKADKLANEIDTEYGITFVKIPKDFTVKEDLPEPMDSYYVQFRDAANDRRLTQRYAARSFAEAESKAKKDIFEMGGDIVSIDLDYK